MKIEYLTFSRQGKRTTQNCDFFVAKSLVKQNQYLFAVCDGMNGIPGGNEASSFCGNNLENDFYLFAPLDHPANWLDDEIHTINRKIQLNKKTKGSASTLLAIVISNNKLFLANAGDCRCLLVRAAKPIQLSKDDNLASELLAKGKINETQYLKHPSKNMLKNYMGKKDGVKLQQESTNIKPDDIILLCSDGISGFLTNQEISRVMQTEWENLDELLYSAAIKAGSHDDITFIAIRIK